MGLSVKVDLTHVGLGFVGVFFLFQALHATSTAGLGCFVNNACSPQK